VPGAAGRDPQGPDRRRPAAVHMILELHRERLEEELEAWLTEEDGARLLER